MADKKLHYTEPKISPVSLDLSKPWYVWFRYYDSLNDQWEQKRYKADLNSFPSSKKRLQQAKALKQILKEKLQDGWNPLNNNPGVLKDHTLSEAIKYILKVKSATLKPKSKYAYTYITKLLLAWLEERGLVQLHVSRFTTSLAQEYMDWLLISKGYSGRTFNDHLIILRTFFNCFIEREWIAKNPFKAVKKKTQTVGRNLAFTDLEIKALDKALIEKNVRLYYFKSFIFHCFIRRTELTFLKVKHIDLVNRTIILPGEGTKNRIQESVVIPTNLEPIIKEMDLYNFNPEDYVFGYKLNTGPRQFKNPNHISTLHNNIVKKLRIDSEKGLYSHKHSGVCKYYYATGKDIHSLMRQLRHREINTTMIYLKSLGLIQNYTFQNAIAM